MLNAKNVLILAPHTDDAELGAGGLISRLADAGAYVTEIIFTGTDGGKMEAVFAAEVMGINNVRFWDMPIRRLGEHRQDILDGLIELRGQYDLVIMPSLRDTHQDHQAVAQEGWRAFKNTNLLGYEEPWNDMHYDAQLFVSLSERDLFNKMEAVYQYSSQRHKEYCDPEYIRSLARVRGVQAGVEYAESFNIVRQIIR